MPQRRRKLPERLVENRQQPPASEDADADRETETGGMRLLPEETAVWQTKNGANREATQGTSDDPVLTESSLARGVG